MSPAFYRKEHRTCRPVRCDAQVPRRHAMRSKGRHSAAASTGGATSGKRLAPNRTPCGFKGVQFIFSGKTGLHQRHARVSLDPIDLRCLIWSVFTKLGHCYGPFSQCTFIIPKKITATFTQATTGPSLCLHSIISNRLLRGCVDR